MLRGGNGAGLTGDLIWGLALEEFFVYGVGETTGVDEVKPEFVVGLRLTAGRDGRTLFNIGLEFEGRGADL